MNRREFEIIQKIAGQKRESPLQINVPFETDTELIRTDHGILSATVDCITEEVKGLFKDPFTIGWMSVLSSLSDTAASGASPLGILLACNIPCDAEDGFIEALFKGAEQCAAHHDTYILGGDTNQSNELSMTSMCLGSIETEYYSKRSGYQCGDKIYVTGTVGRGNFTAFLNVTENTAASKFEKEFRPEVNFGFGKAIARYGSACIDSSDGFFHSLFSLFEQGGNSFTINIDDLPYWNEILPVAIETDIPPSLFAFGEVGDYELVFTVSEENESELLKLAKSFGVDVTCVGQVTGNQGIYISKNGEHRLLDMDAVRAKLSTDSHGDYLKALIEIARDLNI